MKAQNCKGDHNIQQLTLEPHTKWAKKFIALYQCQLSQQEREEVEAHLKECKACVDAYLVYREVAGIVQDRLSWEVPSALPPMLQALKDEQLALAAKGSGKSEPAAEKQETLDDVQVTRPKRKRPA